MATFSNLINDMIESVLRGSYWTSAGGDSPKINKLIDVEGKTDPDFEVEIKNLIRETGEGRFVKGKDESNDTNSNDKKSKKELQNITSKIDDFEIGQIGEIHRMSTKQFGNIRSLASNPTGFVIGSLLKKLGKGAGVVGIALLAVEVAKYLALELFKPGRIFDIRFRQAIDKQILVFMDRKEQQELRQGYKQIITTTIGGLRGSNLANQIGGNFYNPNRIPANYLDERIVKANNSNAQNSQHRSLNIGQGNRDRS